MAEKEMTKKNVKASKEFKERQEQGLQKVKKMIQED